MKVRCLVAYEVAAFGRGRGASMFEWMAKNKEWLFSGIGVSLLFGVVSALRGWFQTKANESETRKSGNFLQPLAALIRNSADSPASRRTASLPSGDEIALAIDNVPAFQREQVRSNYAGLAISWPVVFNNLIKLSGEGYLVILNYGTETWGAELYVAVDIAEYPRLKTATARSTIVKYGDKSKGVHGWIEGRIVSCDRLLGLVIEPTKLEFFD